MTKENSAVSIRVASPDDAEELVEIYAPYVRETAISFEYEVPSVQEFRGRIEETLKKYPYLAAVRDDSIVGYAYAGAFVGRTAYDRSCETSIYIRRDARKGGIGGRLYDVLEGCLKEMGVLNLNACIGYPKGEDPYVTTNSVDFHRHLGYDWVGRFHDCGYKFGRWYDMVWMEKMLGPHPDDPAPFCPFPDVLETCREKFGIE
ncbi:MAG: GNAT family N-acetyltransferase [Anaerovoracaceae bacterium]|jgi:L-amino acid N-acyltransferase YncA